MSFLDKLGREIIVFDGALGSLIQSEVRDVKIPDMLNIERPDLLRKIHRQYVDAGADVITTNTFGANEYKLKACKYTVEEIITAGVKNAKSVSGGTWVALDIGPIGVLMEPSGSLTFDKAYNTFRRQVIAGEKAGCDIILIETMSDIAEARAAVLAAKENSNLPVVCTMTFEENGKTYLGVDPITMTAVLEGLGVDALGVNCSVGPDSIIPIAEVIIKYSSIPVVVQPNAGIPILKGEDNYYPVGKREFALNMKKLVDMGVAGVGGCCGTSPDYIREINELIGEKCISTLRPKEFTIATGTRKSHVFEGLTVIGEALVPTGRKDYTEALRSGNYSFCLNSANKQKKLGAQIVNINVTTPGVDEVVAMKKSIEAIIKRVDIPLQIDSMNSEVFKEALRIYPGKAVVNSVNGTEKSMSEVLPLVKKYGACVIAMPFDEGGIKGDISERLKITEKILSRAKDFGIEKKDIILDCLSLTILSHQQNSIDTLDLIEEVKKNFEIKTMLGIANISYALPKRGIIDRTYLAMALAKGLDVVMMSMYEKDMVETLEGYNVIIGKDKKAEKYRRKYIND